MYLATKTCSRQDPALLLDGPNGLGTPITDLCVITGKSKVIRPSLSPIFSLFFPRFSFFFLLRKAVPTCTKLEPSAEKQWQAGPNTVSAVGLTPGVRNA